MPPTFNLFGPVHIVILGAIPVLAAVLATIENKIAPKNCRIRIWLAVVLLLNSAVWYLYLAIRGWLTFPNGLPLELCDATLGLTIFTLLTLNKTTFDLVYYSALGGTSMALLTPDLGEALPSFAAIEFFLMHGLVLVGILYLIWSKQARPRPGSVWKAMLAVNIFAVAVGTFDFIFRTNYMYLRAKPENSSLLDFMGPWPWYILTAEGIALGLFLLFYQPFRNQAERHRLRGEKTKSHI